MNGSDGLGIWAIGMIVGMIVGGIAMNSMWKSEAIQRSYGIYCPVDGHWSWVGECTE